MFSINSLTGYSIITRNVWLVYSQPAIFRSIEDSNISGSIEVSRQTKSTLNTLKRIAFPISLVDMSTVRIFLTGISRINSNNRFINCFSFVKHMVTHYHGLSKGFHILFRHIQFKFNRSVHIHILPLVNKNSLWLLEGGGRFLSLLKYEVSATPAPRRTQ